QHRTVSYLLVAAHGRERGNRIAERHEPRLRQAGGDADHVLLGHTDIDEAAWMPLSKSLDDGESQVGGQEEDAVVDIRQLDKRLDERCSHPVIPSSASACSANSGVRLR